MNKVLSEKKSFFCHFKTPESTECAVISQSKMNSKICNVFTNVTHNEVLERAADNVSHATMVLVHILDSS